MDYKSAFRIVFALMLISGLSGCASMISPPHLKPLPSALRETLAKKGMSDSAPIFVRVFKKESQLEVWKLRDTGTYGLLKTYPICKWSGGLGPKIKQGDKQAPEGFYNVVQGNMNPNSKFHLSFNLGYPNRFDKAHGRTGAHLMVHGKCKSAGCYAMTDVLMEEIYLLARDAFIGGQDSIPVHAFPFRMTQANMRNHRKNKWYGFWRTLKEGYDHFETHRTVPKVDVCAKRYLINASFIDPNSVVDSQLRCPRYRKFVPTLGTDAEKQYLAKAQTKTPTYIAAGTATAAVSFSSSANPVPSAPPQSLAPPPAPQSLTPQPLPAQQNAAAVRQIRPTPPIGGALDNQNSVLFGDTLGAHGAVVPNSTFESVVSDALRDTTAQ